MRESHLNLRMVTALGRRYERTIGVNRLCA